MIFFDVVGVVHDHLHKVCQRDLIQVPQQNCLHYLEKRFLTLIELTLEYALDLFWPYLGREVMHPHKIQNPEQTLILMMLNIDDLLK